MQSKKDKAAVLRKEILDRAITMAQNGTLWQMPIIFAMGAAWGLVPQAALAAEKFFGPDAHAGFEISFVSGTKLEDMQDHSITLPAYGQVKDGSCIAGNAVAFEGTAADFTGTLTGTIAQGDSDRMDFSIPASRHEGGSTNDGDTGGIGGGDAGSGSDGSFSGSFADSDNNGSTDVGTANDNNDNGGNEKTDNDNHDVSGADHDDEHPENNHHDDGVAADGAGDGSAQKEKPAAPGRAEHAASSQTELVNYLGLGQAMFVNQGADLLSQAMESLINDEQEGFAVFALGKAYNSKYEHAKVDLDGSNFVLGLGNNIRTAGGTTVWAGFYERGNANLDFQNRRGWQHWRGTGDTDYYGGGFAVRTQGNRGVYGEASYRVGQSNAGISTALLNSDGGLYGCYSDRKYYSYHLTAGRQIEYGTKGYMLDYYVKYLHTTLRADDFTIAGEQYHLDSASSDRMRIGARWHQGRGKKYNVYYGLACEYEFGAQESGTASGYRMETTSLRGGTVLAEVGMSIIPDTDREPTKWNLDGTVTGYAGARTGGSLRLTAIYHF